MANVLLCCENYVPSVGGVQEVMRQIAERTAAAGHRVTVATTAHPDRAMECVINGVIVKSFAMGGNLVRGLSGDISAYTDFLRTEDSDVVMIKAAQQVTFDAALTVLDDIKAWKVFIPCGFSGLEWDEFRPYYARMGEYLAKFDKLIFYSGHYRDIDFARQAGLTGLEIVPNGVDEREFFDSDSGSDAKGDTDTDTDTDTVIVLTVGSRIVAKGHWEVLKAFTAARIDAKARLILNGNIPYGSWQRRLAGTARNIMRGRWPLGMLVRMANWRFALRREAKYVDMTDYRRPELLDAYAASDLFLFASHVEYSPLVLFEAAASGTPFISTDVGNAREIAEWTGAGIVASPAVPAIGSTAVVDHLRSALERLLADPAQRTRMAMAGRVQMRTKFCWDTIVPRYWQVMRIDGSRQDRVGARRPASSPVR